MWYLYAECKNDTWGGKAHNLVMLFKGTEAQSLVCLPWVDNLPPQITVHNMNRKLAWTNLIWNKQSQIRWISNALWTVYDNCLTYLLGTKHIYLFISADYYARKIGLMYWLVCLWAWGFFCCRLLTLPELPGEKVFCVHLGYFQKRGELIGLDDFSM